MSIIQSIKIVCDCHCHCYSFIRTNPDSFWVRAFWNQWKLTCAYWNQWNSHAINRTPWVLSSELFTARTKITLRPAPGVHFWIKQANHLHSCAQSRMKARPFRKGWNTWNRTSWGLSARTFLRPMGVLPPKGSCDSTHKRHKQTITNCGTVSCFLLWQTLLESVVLHIHIH